VQAGRRRHSTASALADEQTGKVKYFEGTPIPTSVVIVGILALAFQLGRIDEAMWFGVVRILGADLHPLAMIYAVSGSAMISATLRVPKP
jgi:CDP-diacylglycerol---serine O-phosphatidyltransferase